MKNFNRENFNIWLFILTFLFPVIPISLYIIYNFIKNTFSTTTAIASTSSLITIIVCYSIFYNQHEDIKTYYINYINKIKEEFNHSINELSEENENFKKSHNLKKYIKENFSNGSKYLAEMISDIETIDFDLLSKYLKTKKHPALKKAKDIQDLKNKYKELKIKERSMRYEYDMLFSLFPELENYLEFYSINESNTIEEIKENYDYVKKWISKEEYNSLDENTRNQLALNRYIESRKKSKWAIGRDYEMFIAHEYEEKGYKVTYTGITERLEDKGRDLIAEKDNETLIIQCKNWSKYKEIHENHICQLFGTTVQYNIENNSLFKATPVFITSATLSNTALKFAEYLGVKVIQNKKLEEFPRIKCNINNNEKIYHLPFDQQYDRTIIGDHKGEFFAWTVEEAVNKGFRRAKKYFYTK